MPKIETNAETLQSASSMRIKSTGWPEAVAVDWKQDELPEIPRIPLANPKNDKYPLLCSVTYPS